MVIKWVSPDHIGDGKCCFECFKGKERLECGKPGMAKAGNRYLCRAHAKYAASVSGGGVVEGIEPAESTLEDLGSKRIDSGKN